jgi:hypothetical protein
MKNIIILATTIALAFLIACQYPVGTAKFADTQQFLVINAEISETGGKLQVDNTISDVNALGGSRPAAAPIVNYAYIVDSHGNRTDFMPDGTLDTLFHGMVGSTCKWKASSMSQILKPCVLAQR